MGAGATVNIHPPHIADAHFKKLLGDKAARTHLFKEISEFSAGIERVKFKDRISLDRMIKYFSDNKNALYPDFHVNVDIVNEAFKFAIKKKTKDHKTLTLKDFHRFLPTLFLFVKLWDIFDIADRLVVPDQCVFKGEFVKLKEKLNSIEGVQILGQLSDEEWLEEFTKLDKNNDGHIAFNEFCTYAVSHIKRPFDYAEEFEEYDDTEDADDGPSEDAPNEATAVEATAAADGAVEMADTEPVAAEAVPAPTVTATEGNTPAAGAEIEKVAAADPCAADSTGLDGAPAVETPVVAAEAVPMPVEVST